MASENQINQLQGVVNTILSIDENKLLRPSLGEESLKEDFAPKWLEIQTKVKFLLQYAHELHDEPIGGICGTLHAISAAMQQQADSQNVDYVARRPGFLTNIDQQLEELKRYWPPVVTAAVEARRFLEDEGVRQEYEQTIESIKKESESALQQVQGEARKTIEEARVLAEQIEKRARLTATRISVKEAQEQFQQAQAALDKQVKIWACLGSVCIAGFICVSLYFITVDLPDGWQVIYHSAIRISILTAIGTTAAFCLKILRAQLHMREKNRHRQRVANSMEAFVASAVTPEQRDLILSQLVESVVQFGNSGLVQREDDHVYRPKMTIDSINRTLSTNPQKDV